LDLLQEGQELGVAVSGQAGGDHLTRQHIERRQQRGGTVALVVTGLPLGDAGPQGQDGLGALQGLDLALFVHRQDQGLIRRLHVQAQDVAHPGHEIGVGRELEAFHPVGLQVVSLPDAVHGHVADSAALAQRARAPVGGIPRPLLQGHAQDRGHGGLVHLLVLARPGRVPQQAFHSPVSSKRFRHTKTVGRLVPRQRAGSRLESPSAALRMTATRRATFCVVRGLRAICFNWRRWHGIRTMGSADFPILGVLSHKNGGL